MSAPAGQGVNTELLLKVLAHIEAHPEQWDQGKWVNDCGTAYCFAGWTLVMSGHEVQPEPFGTCLDGELTGHFYIGLAALRELRVAPPEMQNFVAHPMFHPGNSLADLREWVERLTGLDLQDRVVAIVDADNSPTLEGVPA